MSTFRLHPNGTIYLYHWLTPKQPFKASTGLKIEAAKWNKEKMRPRSPNYQYRGLNVTKELIRIESAFLESWNYFQLNGGLTIIKLKQKFKENLSIDPTNVQMNTKPSFLDFFEQKVKEYRALKINNYQGYTTTLNHLKFYFGKEKPDYGDIDTAFYTMFNDHLIEQDLSTNTISNHWKHIKALMKKAQMLKLHNNSDYQFFKRTREDSDTVFLTEQELENILELWLDGYLDKARDYFLIGCFTGLRFSDWDQLSLDKIKDGQAIIRSTKTGERSIIPIANNVLRILGKYPDGKLPRKPSNQKLNEYIKKVAEKAGINEQIEIQITKGGKRVLETKPKYSLISTHTARRSYASILVLNGVPPHLVMKVTGHKSLASFEKYIRFDELQASIQLKQSESFKKTFGAALTDDERMKVDEEFREQTEYYVSLAILGRLPNSGNETK